MFLFLCSCWLSSRDVVISSIVYRFHSGVEIFVCQPFVLLGCLSELLPTSFPQWRRYLFVLVLFACWLSSWPGVVSSILFLFYGSVDIFCLRGSCCPPVVLPLADPAETKADSRAEWVRVLPCGRPQVVWSLGFIFVLHQVLFRPKFNFVYFVPSVILSQGLFCHSLLFCFVYLFVSLFSYSRQQSVSQSIFIAVLPKVQLQRLITAFITRNPTTSTC